ncbi:MAG: hypothetical protein J6U60_01380, partial [Clostridia bacterium]|nr:hypothetical protein [Clostridia bacterium]
MKKLRLFIILNFIIICLACFVGCKPPALSAPSNLTLDEKTQMLTWDQVENCIGYTVEIGELKKNTKKTSFSI